MTNSSRGPSYRPVEITGLTLQFDACICRGDKDAAAEAAASLLAEINAFISKLEESPWFSFNLPDPAKPSRGSVEIMYCDTDAIEDEEDEQNDAQDKT